VNLRDRYFVNPRDTSPRSIRADGESRVLFGLGSLLVSRLPRRKCNTKATAGRCLYKTLAKNTLLVSPVSISCPIYISLPTIKRVIPPYRISGKRAEYIFVSYLCHRRPARYFRKWRSSRHFVKLMKLRLRRLCAIFWTRRGGVYEGLRK